MKAGASEAMLDSKVTLSGEDTRGGEWNRGTEKGSSRASWAAVLIPDCLSPVSFIRENKKCLPCLSHFYFRVSVTCKFIANSLQFVADRVRVLYPVWATFTCK